MGLNSLEPLQSLNFVFIYCVRVCVRMIVHTHTYIHLSWHTCQGHMIAMEVCSLHVDPGDQTLVVSLDSKHMNTFRFTKSR